jgi:hypothetical protein
VEERILAVYQASLDGVIAGDAVLQSTPSPQPEPSHSPTVPAVAAGPKSAGELALEEVERRQFGDSFWGVT